MLWLACEEIFYLPFVLLIHPGLCPTIIKSLPHPPQCLFYHSSTFPAYSSLEIAFLFLESP